MILSLNKDIVLNWAVSIFRFQDLNSTQGLIKRRIHLDPNI